MKLDFDAKFLRSLKTGRIYILSHKRWKIFQQEIPHIIALGKLKFLKISFGLEQPENIDLSFLLQFPNIEGLEIADLPIRELASEIFQLSRLQILELKNLHLTMVPPELAHLTELRKITILNCNLNSFPPEIFTLKKLEKLSLINCSLAELPHEIGQLKRLTKLFLSNNQIREIPAEIGHLKHLTELSVRNNLLSTLPPELGCLTDLRRLDIEQLNTSETITELPHEMMNCTKIEIINGIKQVEPIPLSLYVNWPEYRADDVGEPKVQLPPEMQWEPALSRLNPAFEYSYASNPTFIAYPIENLFDDLLAGQYADWSPGRQDIYRRMFNHFTNDMKEHLLRNLPREHAFVYYLLKSRRHKVGSGYHIQM
ncbi:MAG: leucine-rich repeat domain-containing protein [Promethearchaeota archaeon]